MTKQEYQKIIEDIPELWNEYIKEKGYIDIIEVAFTSFIEYLKKKIKDNE